MAEATKKVVDTTTHRAQGALDRELFCPRLQRLLLGSASELGLRGNLAQVVASIERGGVGGGGEDPNLGMLRRLGATDTRGIDNRIGQLRDLSREWGLLDREAQALLLAHYLGTSRAHATIRQHFGQGQGGLAGVALFLWQQKKAKERDRAGGAAGAKLAEQLDAVRAELAPLERAAAEAQAVLDAPVVLPEPTEARPEPPEVPALRSDENPGGISKAKRSRLLRPYNDALRKWREPVRNAAQEAQRRRRDAVATLERVEPLLPPLRDAQARLCAQLGTIAAAGDTADDELALVQLCRSGNLGTDLIGKAEAKVRVAHRAWYAARKQLAQQWADGEGTAA